MPFPVLHSFAGYSVYALSKNKEDHFKLALYCMFLANAADLDFIPGILIGQAGRFHHDFSHSFGAAILVGLLSALGMQVWKKRGALKGFLISCTAYASHVILDLSNGRCKGMPLFWPLSSHRFSPNFRMDYLDKAKSIETADLGGFLEHLVSEVSLKRFTLEIIFVGAVWLSFFIWKETKKRTLLKSAAPRLQRAA